MASNREVLKSVPLFSLLDDNETALAAQVKLKTFKPRQRIYKIGDPGGRAYVMVSGNVRVTTIDEDQQEVVVDEPAVGEFFGFASMLDQTVHQTGAVAVEETVCAVRTRCAPQPQSHENPLSNFRFRWRGMYHVKGKSSWMDGVEWHCSTAGDRHVVLCASTVRQPPPPGEGIGRWRRPTRAGRRMCSPSRRQGIGTARCGAGSSRRHIMLGVIQMRWCTLVS